MVETIHPCFHEAKKHKGTALVAVDANGRTVLSSSADCIRRWDVTVRHGTRSPSLLLSHAFPFSHPPRTLSNRLGV